MAHLRSGVEISIMADDLPGEQDVLQPGAGADVVDNLIIAREPRFGIADHSYVQQTPAQVPGNYVSRQVVLSFVGDRQRFPFEIEVSHQVLNPAMIDIGVGPLSAPFIRIGGKVERHVLVDFFLKVDAGFPESPDYYVLTNPSV